MSSSELFSHPGKPLADHLEQVASLCENKFRAHRLNLENDFDRKSWRLLIWMMGFFHDLGKATPFFQAYLTETDRDEKMRKKAQKETSHALLSAVLGHFIIRRIVRDKPINNDLWTMMPFFIFLAIKRHHGNLGNAVRMNNSDDRNELDIDYEHIDTQFYRIEPDAFDRLMVLPREKWHVSIQKTDFPTDLSGYFKQHIYRNDRTTFKRLKKKLSYYFIFQYLFSILIQSDKKEAIFNIRHSFERKELPRDIVKEHIRTHFDPPENPMDIIRRRIFDDADRNISDIDLETGRILSLNVPTGTGKTLTSFSAALQLRARLASEKNRHARIIYALPFTSIIDQNHQVFENVLAYPESDVLLKHHHLSDVCFKTVDHEFETDEAKFLMESWESEIVVTTFFQLFHSLMTNRNRMLIKFERLVNAIVLCDEIQSLPYQYWKVARRTMSCLSKRFNTWFILITATQPKIFEPNEITELIPEKTTYFSQLDRVDITIEEEPLTLQEYKAVCRRAIETSDESFLFVMNTVNSASELFRSLENIDCKADFFFLATTIVPVERLARIRDIRQSKNRKIIVSTQMIEAGVDISIDNVWRDMGPLESINQVCGRCNRHFDSKKGKVRIFRILDETNRNKPFESYIYGKNRLSMPQTRAILTGNNTICEADFLKNMDAYYDGIKQRLTPKASDDLLEFMENLQFLSVFNNFRLIEEDHYERKDIFIALNDEAERIWSTYLDLRTERDKWIRKSRFLKIQKVFQNYVISVPAKFVHEEAYEDTNIVYISKEMIPACYHYKTGWIRQHQGVYTF